MKKYLLGLTLAALASAPMYGVVRQQLMNSSSGNSEQINLSNASARDTESFALTTAYQEIPFIGNVEVYGDGIEVLSDTQFYLEQGVYLITYSGSTEYTDDLDSGPTFINYALNLETSQVIEFSDSGEGGYDSYKLKSFTMEVPVPWPSVLTIQARIDPSTEIGSGAIIHNRAIGIVKIG